MPELPINLIVKLASLVVHLQETDLARPTAEFDVAAAKAIADDPEVVEWLKTIDPVLLPEKR